jgi:hypothetical protein
MSQDDPVSAASERYLHLQEQADAAKSDFFAICAERVRARLDTADTIAARSFPTAVTIRKELRIRGVEALPRGPKSRE